MGRYFGLRALGTAFGYGFGSYVFGGALGALLMGAGFDLTHSYTVPLAGFFIAMVLAAWLMTRLGPYRYAARQTGELPPVVKVHVGSPA
jgi:cyanate permease